MPSGPNDRIQFTPEFLERYSIRRLIGEGGSGAVYEAEQKSLGRVVAVKFLSNHLFLEEESVRRFLDEGKITARLTHGNIVTIYDFGVMGETPYAVFEFISGKPLRSLLDSSRRLPVTEALRITQESLAGLSYAHGLGVVHRDLKPENLLLEPDGRVKIADFGLAKGREKRDYKTRAGVVLGTPEYISPEQASGQEATPQSDLYSLGIMLYEMLSGAVPFSGSNDMAILIAHVQKTPRPLQEILPGIPTLVAEIVARSLEKQPGKRFASADEFAEKLEELQPYVGRSTREVPSGVVRMVRASSTGRMAARPRALTSEIRTGQRAIVGLLAGLALLIVGVAAGTYFFRASLTATTCSVDSVQIRPGVHTSTLEWRSNVATTGTIELAEEGAAGTDDWRRITTPEEQPGLEHRVVLSELKPETSYRFRFVYPDGSTSILYSFQTARPFRPEGVEIDYLTADKVALTVRSAEKVRLSAEFPGTERLEAPSEAGLIHTLVITGVNPMSGIKGGMLKASYSGDEKSDLPLEPVPSLPETLAAEVDRLDLAALIGGLDKQLAALPAAQRQAAFSSRLKKERVYGLFQLFRGISSAFFLSTQVSMEDKLKIYGWLTELENVDALANLYQLKSPLDVAPTYSGLVSRTYTDPIPEPVEFDSAKYETSTAAFYPENFDFKGMPLYRDTMEIVQGRGRTHETFHFTFRGPPDQRFNRAALMIKVSQLPPRIYFEATLNGRLRLLFRSPSAGYASLGQPAAEVYNCFWPEFLKSPENTVELRLKTLPGLKPTFNSLLYEIGLKTE